MSIISKPLTAQGRKNHDAIFRKRKPTIQGPLAWHWAKANFTCAEFEKQAAKYSHEK
jgi:hypothetical protein